MCAGYGERRKKTMKSVLRESGKKTRKAATMLTYTPPATRPAKQRLYSKFHFPLLSPPRPPHSLTSLSFFLFFFGFFFLLFFGFLVLFLFLGPIVRSFFSFFFFFASQFSHVVPKVAIGQPNLATRQIKK